MAKLSKKELEALVKNSNEQILLETSYNRVRSHVEGGSAFVIITADRHEHSSAENRRRYQELKAAYKSAGYPFTEIKGGFKETTKTIEDPETGESRSVELEEPVHVTESAILVTTHIRGDVARPDDAAGKDLFDLSVSLSRQFDQEAFIFGETASTESGRTFKDIRAYDANGSEIKESWAGPWNSLETVEADSDFWSRVKSKHFQLKEAEKEKTTQPKSWFEAMKQSRSGKTW
tara:strand:- start:770 stop:1468 length:699 start_codon:yes stop_codon:yes gene_type:complete